MGSRELFHQESPRPRTQPRSHAPPGFLLRCFFQTFFNVKAVSGESVQDSEKGRRRSQASFQWGSDTVQGTAGKQQIPHSGCFCNQGPFTAAASTQAQDFSSLPGSRECSIDKFKELMIKFLEFSTVVFHSTFLERIECAWKSQNLVLPRP